MHPAAGPAAAGAPPAEAPELLRLATAGSVDDGKSTLIGRLLLDTGSVPDDQLAAIESATRRRGEEGVNLALLTDGLRAEREQNITIDVAYRYFSTPRRRFIIADTPGHVEYTRNMVTGASTADLALVLVDAEKGVLTQSKRHGFLAALLGVPHLVVAVNKMDRVGWSRAAFEEIAGRYREFAEKLDVPDLVFIPISALLGDNVVRRSGRMEWFGGTTLLHHLETAHLAARRNLTDFRFPVQHVLRAPGFRGLAGRIASGTVAPGDEVVVLPGGRAATVRSVETADGPLAGAAAGDSVVIALDDDVDAGRGDLLARPLNRPTVGDRIDAVLCWMGDRPLDPAAGYVLRHATRTARARVERVVHRIDVDTLHREGADTLEANEIGRVRIAASAPLCFDPYAANRETGSFILVDPFTHATVAAGVIRGEALPDAPADEASADGVPAGVAPASEPDATVVGVSSVHADASTLHADGAGETWRTGVPRGAREARNGHGAAVVWLTGLPAAGKSTLARAAEEALFARGVHAVVLDGDALREGVNAGLGFDEAARAESVRRAGEVARLFFDAGAVVLCALVSPFRDARERLRARFPDGRFVEVFVDCPVDECRRRDPKGLYAGAARGEVAGLTGVSAPYEPPEAPELRIRSELEDARHSVARLLELLERRGILPAAPAGE